MEYRRYKILDGAEFESKSRLFYAGMFGIFFRFSNIRKTVQTIKNRPLSEHQLVTVIFIDNLP